MVGWSRVSRAPRGREVPPLRRLQHADRSDCGSPVSYGLRSSRFAEQVEACAPVHLPLDHLILLTFPSTGPELWGSVRQAVTASKSPVSRLAKPVTPVAQPAGPWRSI